METETISIAFSSEVDTGSYQKNTSNKVATFGRALALPHAEYPQINDLSGFTSRSLFPLTGTSLGDPNVAHESVGPLLKS